MVAIWKKRADELARLSALSPQEQDDAPHVHGVLLSDEIIRLVDAHKFIDPFDRIHLKPAAYELTIGDEYFVGGAFIKLTDNDDRVVIPPFEVAVIKTAETLCMPRFIIGRWNIKVRHAYRGLLWVGGPQVDPGYVGHLFCPIYNLSDKTVRLAKGEEIAVIDFVKTTPFKAEKLDSEPYERYPRTSRPIIEDFGIENLRSALFTKAGEKIDEMDAAVKAIETRFVTFTQIIFATLALTVSLMAALLKTDQELRIAASVWGSMTLAASVAAVSIALFWFVSDRLGKVLNRRLAELSTQRPAQLNRFLRRNWLIGLFGSIAISVSAGVFVYLWSAPVFSDLRSRDFLVKADLEPITRQMRDDIRSDLSSANDRVSAQLAAQSRVIQDLTRQLYELQTKSAIKR